MPKRLAILDGKPSFNKKMFITQPVVPSIDELNHFLIEILGNKQLTNDGPYVRELENKLEKYLESPHCLAFCNGTLALQLCIKGMELSGEVITTPFTFPATPHTLYWNDITPVFCDIDPDTYNLDPKKIEALISPKTTGILAAHIFGNPCDVESIGKIANRHGLKVIYDAAHAFGVKVNNKSIGGFGDASMFSFHATKIFNTLEGGAITGADKDLYQKLRDFRNFGIRGEEEVASLGINAKMNEIQAAFGLINLKKISNSIKKRKTLFARYYNQLSKLPGLQFQKIDRTISYNYSYLPIRILLKEFGLSRDDVYVCMRKEQIMVRKYFYPLCSNYPCYQALSSAKKKLLPNANKVSSSILCLPLYDEMDENDVDKITEVISLLHNSAPKIKKLISSKEL